ncbi:hypothetical protein F4604DRAFT_1938080 [Suillus subluteus]|nr:hypothetical protein F4604DRAFT_1938080 [Suillus subluteus]
MNQAPMLDAATTSVYKCSAIRASQWSSSSRPYIWYKAVMFPRHHQNHMDGLTVLKMSHAQSIHEMVCPEDHSPAKEEDTSSELSISDIWIGPGVAAADSLDNSSSEHGEESSMSRSGTETLMDVDPTLEFNWFVTTSHCGVGLYNEISTVCVVHAPGTSIHYFTTLGEAKDHFRLALVIVKTVLKGYRIRRALASARALCPFPEYCPLFQSTKISRLEGPISIVTDPVRLPDSRRIG